MFVAFVGDTLIKVSCQALVRAFNTADIVREEVDLPYMLIVIAYEDFVEGFEIAVIFYVFVVCYFVVFALCAD